MRPALAACLAFAACTHTATSVSTATPSPPEAAWPREAPPPAAKAGDAGSGQLTIIATGDILMQETVKAAAAAVDVRAPDGGSLNHGGFDVLFAGVAPLFARPDALAFGNLESPIARLSDAGVRPFVFDGPPEVLDALQSIGFLVLSCANNHAYDQGTGGLVETIANVRTAGLFPVGAGADHTAARAPLIVERNGLKLGFLAYATRLNENLNTSKEQQPEVNFVEPGPEPGRMEQEVQELAGRVDAVVVAIHWGVEYADVPEAEHTALAHRLVNAGALVLLGSHPHVLQRVERYGKNHSLIAYSLGNFVSNQSRHYLLDSNPPSEGDPRDGIALAVTLGRTAAGVRIVAASYRPIWTENNGKEHERDAGVPPIIRLVRTETLPEVWKVREPRYKLRIGTAVNIGGE
jgi:poly-gamma-glutamate synthesis protein (capsule biosynthesis protein)